MPYLSWYEGEILVRHRLDGDSTLGRDSLDCTLAKPEDPSISRRHALLSCSGEWWWIRDLGSRNGTILNGLLAGMGLGSRVEDGDEILLGDWCLRFTLEFPGLDGVNFIEGVGDLFSEVRPESAQALILVRGLELLHRATEALMKEDNSSSLVRSLLDESLSLLVADRGFVVTVEPDGSLHTIYRVGDIQDQVGLSQSVLRYVRMQRTGVLSNLPLLDPRFGGSSLVELNPGPLLCAPMESDGEVIGFLYLDRAKKAKGFTRLELAFFQSFVRLGAITLHHTSLTQKAIGQAEIRGEYLRLKSVQDRLVSRSGEVFTAMRSSLRWIQAYSEQEGREALRQQVGHLLFLAEAGLQDALPDAPREEGRVERLAVIQATFQPIWSDLLAFRGASLEVSDPPEASIWVLGPLMLQALLGLVEPLLMQMTQGGRVVTRWAEDGGRWTLTLELSTPMEPPVPDPWTLHALADSGVAWHWNQQLLVLSLPKALAPSEGTPLLLGVVTEEFELMGLFESVVAAGGLTIQPMGPQPPQAPMPRLAYLAIDAKGLEDPVGTVQAFRHHPSFVTVPILVVRAAEELFAPLLAVGATDCLPEGFRWEILHHRLQVLKGHEELQRKALAAERLDTFRQMAGTLKHEINNPLAVISMQVELLERKYPEEAKLVKIGAMVERIRGLLTVLQEMRESPTAEYPGGGSIVKLR